MRDCAERIVCRPCATGKLYGVFCVVKTLRACILYVCCWRVIGGSSDCAVRVAHAGGCAVRGFMRALYEYGCGKCGVRMCDTGILRCARGRVRRGDCIKGFAVKEVAVFAVAECGCAGWPPA